MDSYEATSVVYSRIQDLDPENASKIIGLLLIQDHGEKEMIRLAFGPDSLLHSVIFKARNELGISSNTSSAPSTPSSPFFSPSLSRQKSASSSIINGVSNLPSSLIIPNPSSSWTDSSNFFDFQRPQVLISPGNYDNNCGSPSSNGLSNLGSGSSPSAMNSSAQPFYRGGEADLNDDLHLQEQLSFLNDGSPPLGPKSLDFVYPGQPELASSPSCGGYAGWLGGPHRRSCSVNDIILGGADDPAGGFGWKPCLYYARGYCKNGTSCRFVHGRSLVDSDEAAMVGSPSKLEVMEQCQELFRSKSAHQHRLAAASQLMGGSLNFPHSPNKCMNHFLHQQENVSPRAAAAAALMSGRYRNEFSMGMGMADPSSMQIYLTFPADSTFKEEDVSNYFSIYGPVQDVRIPYQQKRMFGFVTFVYPETVKLILAKGNPHFVCDSRVLVKPYKEKGKVPDKFRKQQQLMEREEYSTCGSPTSFDSGDPFDIQLEARMLYENQQDLLWRRKLEEQANLQQAIELQNRRLMSLQLLDIKRNHHHCAAISSPTRSPGFVGHSSFYHSNSDRSSPEEDDDSSRLGTPAIVNVDDQQTVNGFEEEREKEKDFLVEEKEGMSNSNGNGNGKSSPHLEESDWQESMEHNLPDSLFASPKAASIKTAFSTDTDEVDKNCNGSIVVPASLCSNNLITPPLLSA